MELKRGAERLPTRQLRSVCLTLFAEWMKSKHHPRSVKVSFLTRTVLEDYYDHLIHQRGVSQHTANDRIRYVGMFWAWAYDRDEYPSCPRPRRIELPEATPALAPVAPSWEQMDEAIEAAGDGWYRKLFTVLRYTGLRRGQAMELRWSDFDLERGMLTVRPELGKTKQERRGRVIPVSQHLLAEVAGWGRREGYLIDTTPARGPQPKKRQVHNGHAKRIWRKTTVPEDRYRQPCHCFRKGFVSELVRAGATERSVRRLVGHSGGVTFDVYTSAWAMEDELRQAVDLIPAVGAVEATNVLSLGSEGVPEGSKAGTPIVGGSGT